jgi:hypothetical protein
MYGVAGRVAVEYVRAAAREVDARRARANICGEVVDF